MVDAKWLSVTVNVSFTVASAADRPFDPACSTTRTLVSRWSETHVLSLNSDHRVIDDVLGTAPNSLSDGLGRTKTDTTLLVGIDYTLPSQKLKAAASCIGPMAQSAPVGRNAQGLHWLREVAYAERWMTGPLERFNTEYPIFGRGELHILRLADFSGGCNT